MLSQPKLPKMEPEPEDCDKEMQDLLKQIEGEEAEVDNKLIECLSLKTQLEMEVQSISESMPNLHIVKSEAKELEEMVNFTSTLAEKVSSKVRQLDLARSRVSDCQKRVHDLLDLQLCSNGVETCLQNEDFEKAAAHIHRFLSMDQNLLKQTADDMAQDCTTVTTSFNLLQQAASNLRSIMSNKFQVAVDKKDSASVERYFKLFPLIDMHQFGLEQYSKFICTKLKSQFKENMDSIRNNEQRASVVFADLLTFVFENIAREIEAQQPLIDTYYGEGRIITLILAIQAQCDEMSSSIVTELWTSRQIESKISLINDYSKVKPSNSSGDKLEPKSLDPLLNEMTIIHSRYMLYVRFLKRRLQDTNDLDESLRKSELCRKMQEILGNYLLLERYYLEESVKKAISMDAIEHQCLQSSMLDDVFFILRKCIRRASSGGSLDGICAVINNGSLVLEDQFLDAIHRYLRQGYPSGYMDLTQAYNVVMQGRNDAEQSRVQFLTYLNNLEVAAEYVTTLIQSLNEEIPCPSERDKEKLQSCLSGLSGVTSNLGTVKEYGLQQLRSAAIKPRVAPWIDVYLSLNHNLTEEEFVAYEANEPFIGSLVMHLDTLLSEFKPRLTQSNYDSLVSILALEVTSHLERVIVKCEFNRLGGMALDKEVRGLVSYLSGATSWTIRDRLARLMQISTVLNLDKVTEISDYVSSATWRLSTSDVRQFMALRQDFNKEDIMRL
uniref:Conserved oligomeric Golgi complex subunit 4 n=1 Tax=Cacopsylla melanoneura TaxID=428564 RepID=A0A8D8WQE2_9HEMI